jgi:secreted trypsin-like serine protease
LYAPTKFSPSIDGPASDQLRYTTVRIITNAVCQQTFGTNVVIASTICAVGDPSTSQSTCSGDSGGPMVINEGGTWTQVGVVSFVSNAGCAIGHPSGYVRTASFLSWINSHTGVAVRP